MYLNSKLKLLIIIESFWLVSKLNYDFKQLYKSSATLFTVKVSENYVQNGFRCTLFYSSVCIRFDHQRLFVFDYNNYFVMVYYKKILTEYEDQPEILILTIF